MTKKGAITDLFVFSSILIGLIILCALMIFLNSTLKQGLLDNMDAIQGNSQRNFTKDVNNLFGASERSFQATNYYIMFIFVALVISFLVSNAYIRTNPYWFGFYLFVVGIAVVFAIGIKRVFFQLAGKPILASAFAQLSSPNWIVTYLPIIVTAVGFIGAIFLFVRLSAGDEF